MNDFLSQFHFLRPEMFWVLAILPLVYWLIKRGQVFGDDWSRVIPASLLQHLRAGQDSNSSRRSLPFVLILALLITVFALAGPSWKKIPQPVTKVSDDMIVILDLSLSMLATDITPTRLTRAKQKLQDLLALRTEGNTALVVFSGDAHVVTPLTDDTNTIVANLPALDPYIMPEIGSRPDLAIEEAIALLDQASAGSARIVMLTDGVASHQIERIEDQLNARPIRVDVLAVGTEPGGPIDLGERGYLKQDGQVVIPKTDYRALSRIAAAHSGKFTAMQLDDKDLELLEISGDLSDKRAVNQENESIDPRYDTWQDSGYWLLLLVIPLILFSYRQGLILVLAICLLPSQESMAEELPGPSVSWWSSLWQTRDQQAQSALNQGDAATAAQLFESPEHKLFAQAQTNSFNASAFEQLEAKYPDLSSDYFYNKGNALAKSGAYPEAIDAYDQALALDPNNEDAGFNRAIVEQLQNQAQQSEQSSQDQANQDQQGQDSESNQNDASQESGGEPQQSEPSDQQENGSEQQNNASRQGSEQQSQQDSAQNPNDSQAESSSQQEAGEDDDQKQAVETDPQEQSRNQEDLDNTQEASRAQVAEADALSDEERQSFEQWMRRVPDDPGGLLRRKFQQQSQERNRNFQPEGEPLW